MKVTLDELARLLVFPERPHWRTAPGKYRCPRCGSDSVARERNETRRYPGGAVNVERLIRCMDCGEEDLDEVSR